MEYKEVTRGVCAPKGFAAAWGVHCGVRAKRPTKATWPSSSPTRSARRRPGYTMNQVKAAPLYVTMEHLEDGTAWGVRQTAATPTPAAP